MKKVAAFIASGSGMGADAAKHLSSKGYDVAIMSSSGKGEELAKKLEGFGYTGSNLSSKDIDDFISQTLAKFGKIDVLINSAGHGPKGKILDDVWKIPMLGQNDKTERVGYSTQKPVKLLLPIIDSSCPKDGVVADFFCGSGTTIVAAKQLNRKYIGCDMNKEAVDITKNRVFMMGAK